jgi:hypothetical protein
MRKKRMPDQKANWTIMVYISADNILFNFAVESLKQLKRSAGDGVVAVAQLDASGNHHARRYLFDGAGERNSSLGNNEVPINEHQPSQRGIADPKNLTNFIDWALKEPKCAAKHRCLYLWGHGTGQLLVDEDQPGKAGATGRNYLTPRNLRAALLRAKPPTHGLDIIGIDACAMSLIELATELQGCADYMIASQDDVPDLSFPYEEMLSELKVRDLDDVEGMCAVIPKLYKQAYQDYLVTPGCEIGERTLTSLRLKQVSGVVDPLKKLATALNADAFNEDLGTKIHEARRQARDFALGLFVDLYDFCSKLADSKPGDELTRACEAVCEAIDASQAQLEPHFKPSHRSGSKSDSKSKPCILENQTSENGKSRCHGLSIYFPYLTKKDRDEVQKSLEAGPKPADVQLPVQIKGGPLHLDKARGARIVELETDFGALDKFQQESGWGKFIQQGWSYILATKETKPYHLDMCYSGEQCAKNLAAMVHNVGVAKSRVAHA